jgi:carbon monoxide dehydrogenase subunit G
MASVRNHIRIARSPDDVWKVVSEAAALHEWAPGVTKSSASGNWRHVEFEVGFVLEEEIVTSDDELRRFQYRVAELGDVNSDAAPAPNPLDQLATVDVIEDGDGALVIYSTEVAHRDDPGSELELMVAETAKSVATSFGA